MSERSMHYATTQVRSCNGIKIRATSGGFHIFNRDTGTNILIDEIRPAAEHITVAPRQVSIALTNACDLKCAYCYAPKSPAALPLRSLSSWLLELDELGTIGVGFGGGEPTLYRPLAELCAFTMAETNLAITLTTHAHRLTGKLLDSLSGNINFVRVSMDGVSSTYESNRGRSFEELIQRIKALRSIVSFGINFVVNSDTIRDLDQALDIASELGASEFLLLPEISTRARYGIDSRTNIELQNWVYSYRGTVPLAVSEKGSNGLPICEPLGFETGLAAFAHIDAQGILKQNSYATSGIMIGDRSIFQALQELKETNRGYSE